MADTSKTTKRTPLSYTEMVRGRFETARRAISNAVFGSLVEKDEIDLSGPYGHSRSSLFGYVTLDYPHWQAVRRVRQAIVNYGADRTRRRPLNIMMRAEPGSGKSYLVQCLAKGLVHQERASAVDFNLASLERVEDLIQPLDAVRNLKVQDRLPILFLDEFDSDPSRYPLLLPLLWDGELNVAHRNLRLGKLVIILAGSGKSIATEMAAAKAMQGTTSTDGKLVDLLSRINGGELEIPPLDLQTENRDRRVDKVCLAISLLEARFGEQLQLVPLSLLRFIATGGFRYGVRSLAHLVDLIVPTGDSSRPGKHIAAPTKIEHSQLHLPLSSIQVLRDSSLAYHIYSEDGPAAIIDSWKAADETKAMVRIHEAPEEDDIPF